MYYRYFAHDRHRPAHLGLRNEDYTLAFFYGKGLGLPGANNDPDRQTTPAWELYDLKKDPYQTSNVYGLTSYADITAQMKKEIIEQRKQLKDNDAGHPEMQAVMANYWN